MLANAPVAPSSDSNMELVLISAGVVLVVGILGFIPIQLARISGHRHRDAITAIIILWGLILAGSISYSIMKQMDWATTYQQRIETGYYDPQNISDKPVAPVGLWCGVGVCYAGLVLWASRRS